MDSEHMLVLALVLVFATLVFGLVNGCERHEIEMAKSGLQECSYPVFGASSAVTTWRKECPNNIGVQAQ